MKRQNNTIKTQTGAFLVTVTAIFLLVIVWLLSSFQLVIYGDSSYRFYEKEYKKYQVTEELHMELADVMDVTEYMMDYLIGKESTLSIETTIEGKTQDFFNEQDRLHMADVRNLFLGGLKLRNFCAALALVLLGGLLVTGTDTGKLLLKAYGVAILVFGSALLFLVVAFAVDFTRCFTIFHQIFFTNDLWMFDPAADYMIRMLPEGFFSDMVRRIVEVFAAGLVLLGTGCWVIVKKLRYKR